MAKTCFPLDDTNYLAKDLRLWHIGRTNGLINYTGNDFSVTPDEGMNVTLGPGYMYMFIGTKDPGGIIFGETEEQQLSGYVADAYVRYDYICIEYDAELNDAVPKFVKGTRDMPTPVRNETVYQNIVAVIRVKANASKIDQEDIIDTRMKEEYCGLAVDMLSKIPTDEYYNQFMAFMKTIEGTLGEDAAGNLLLQINQIKQDYVPKSYIVDDLSIGGSDKVLSAEQGKILSEKVIGLNSTISPLSRMYNGAEILSLNSGSGTYNLLSKSQLCSALGISTSSFNQNRLCGYVINASHGVNNARFDLNYNYLSNNLVLSYDNATQGNCAITYVLMYFKSVSTEVVS